MMWRVSRLVSVLLVITLSLPGCKTSCERACKKVIEDCDGGYEGFPADQCQSECEAMMSQYKDKDTGSDEMQDALQEQLDCIGASECGPLTDPADPGYPACYDPNLSVF